MIHLKTIYKILGSLLFIEASLMLWCLGMAFYYHEDDTLAFLISVIVTLFLGFNLRYMGRQADNTLSRRDAYLVVTLTWTIFSVVGTLPFLISGYLTNFTDAFFETMSGFTTTGATVIDNVEQLTHGLLFWRSLMQWIGGLGIVFFTIALIPSMGGGSVKVFSAEATGPIRAKLHPRLSTSAKWLWVLYVLLTLACMASFVAVGMSLFEGLNYAMTSTATGGFAIHNDGIAHFNVPAVEYICSLFCFLSGINFTLLYIVCSKLRFKALFSNNEFKTYLFLTLFFIASVTLLLVFVNHYDVEHALRSATFQVVTFITSTGLFNDDIAAWPTITWVILGICMAIGACSGSTSSGMKSIRVVMLFKIVQNEFRQILHPNAVLPLHINGTNVPMRQRVTLLAFLTTFISICLIMFVVLITYGIDVTNAMTITLSCISNVGPSLDVAVGPSLTWSALPAFVKWLCAFVMLIGRLEIFSVLVIFTRTYWEEN